MSEVSQVKFKDFIKLQRGFDLPKHHRVEGEYPVVASTSISDYHAEYKVLPPGVTTGRSGALGEVLFITKPFWPLNTVLWVKDFKGNLPRYVYYYLKTLDLKRYNSGAGVPTLNRNHLDTLDIALHDLSTQQKIVAILSAYDDLIENNTRRIKILEEMAQRIYREWFVHFRYPGQEKAKFVDSPLGKIPEGWEVKKLGDISLNFDRKRKPLSKMQRAKIQGEYPYYGAAKVLDFVNDYIFDGVYLLMAEDGSVITPERRPVLQYVSGKFWANNHTHILQGKGHISTEFLHIALSNVDIAGYITGTAQPKINQDNLNRIPIIVATDSLMEKFDNIVTDIFRQRINFETKNANLRQTRDLLLQKLISGELDVSELDIETGGQGNGRVS